VSTQPQPFISEDDLSTFEGWLKYQGYNVADFSPDELRMWRETYDEVTKASAAVPKVGLMKLPPLVAGEHRYAVAVRADGALWLTLWVRRSRKGEYFVMLPRGDRAWNPHASYHRNGNFHQKSFDRKFSPPQKRQSLTGVFRGAEHLGAYGGHGPKGVGAICDPSAFNGIVEVPPGVLGPRDGQVVVDLVEPGCEPLEWPVPVVQQQVFTDFVPWVVIRICRNA
jgi:hypothetical protein